MLAKTRYGYGLADALVRQHTLRSPDTGGDEPAIRIDAIWRKSQKHSEMAILTVAEARQLIDQIQEALKVIQALALVSAEDL